MDGGPYLLSVTETDTSPKNTMRQRQDNKCRHPGTVSDARLRTKAPRNKRTTRPRSLRPSHSHTRSLTGDSSPSPLSPPAVPRRAQLHRLGGPHRCLCQPHRVPPGAARPVERGIVTGTRRRRPAACYLRRLDERLLQQRRCVTWRFAALSRAASLARQHSR